MTDTDAIPSATNDSRGFYLLDPSSVENVTRASTPDPEDYPYDNDEDYGPISEKSTEVLLDVSPGVLHNDVYDSALPWWRAGIRRCLVKNLKKESAWIAAMQVSCQSA